MSSVATRTAAKRLKTHYFYEEWETAFCFSNVKCVCLICSASVSVKDVTYSRAALHKGPQELFAGLNWRSGAPAMTGRHLEFIAHYKVDLHFHKLSVEYGDLLLHTDVRWLSQGKILQRFLSLLAESKTCGNEGGGYHPIV